MLFTLQAFFVNTIEPLKMGISHPTLQKFRDKDRFFESENFPLRFREAVCLISECPSEWVATGDCGDRIQTEFGYKTGALLLEHGVID